MIPIRTGRLCGYTLVELMVVVALLGILTVVSVPQYFMSVKRARAAQCRANRDALVKAASSLVQARNLGPGQPAPSIGQFLSRVLLSARPQCTAGGVYYWVAAHIPDDGVPVMGCSVHWVP